MHNNTILDNKSFMDIENNNVNNYKTPATVEKKNIHIFIYYKYLPVKIFTLHCVY